MRRFKTVSDSYGESQIILLVGGKRKEVSWAPVVPLINSVVEKLIIFGEEANEILSELKNSGNTCSVKCVDSVSSAVRESLCGDYTERIILFSPGCASFDAYKNYEERGADFKQLIKNSFLN